MWLSASFVSIEKLTNITWKFTVKPQNDIKYIPGQFIQVKINQLVRSYSIASYNDYDSLFELLIVKLKGGEMSKILFEKINIGDEFKIKGPIGRFTLPEKVDSDIFFICTGTGLAPFRSILHLIKYKKISHKNIYLIFGTRTKNDLLCFDEMKTLEDEINGLNYLPVLSRENWEGDKGYVHDLYKKILNEKKSKNPIFYLCGWRNMVREARTNLKEMGFESKKIKIEIYD